MKASLSLSPGLRYQTEPAFAPRLGHLTRADPVPRSKRFASHPNGALSAYACRLGMQRRAVACLLTCVVVNRDLETVVGSAPRRALEHQIMPNDPQRFQVGGAFGAFPLFLIAALFLRGIGAGGG